jgi:hypothetical protein
MSQGDSLGVSCCCLFAGELVYKFDAGVSNDTRSSGEAGHS